MYTSPSPLPRRAPLRLPFSVHIRKLFFLFLSLLSGAPRRTHPVGAGVCPSVCPAVAPFSHPVGAGVLDGPHRFSSTLPAGLFRTPMDAPVGAGVPDGPHRFSFMPTAGIFRAPARHPFAHGGKRMQKRRQRPMVFGIPFVRLQSRRKKVPQRIACTSITAAAPTPRAAALCSPNIKNRRPKGPHLHLPPTAASARFDNRPNGRPAHPPRRMRERQR